MNKQENTVLYSSAIEWNSIYENYINIYGTNIQKPWRSISKEEYYGSLECLPPHNWHKINERFEVFYITEAYTDALYAHIVNDKVRNVYFSALRSRFTTDNELLSELSCLKSTECLHVLRLMGQQFSYEQALKEVLKNSNVSKPQLELELSYFIQ